MKFPFLPSILTLILFLTFTSLSLGQTVIKGKVRDAATGEGLVSASVVVKGTTDGMVTDYDGNFEFTTNSELPFTIEVSYVGYLTQTLEVTAVDQNIRIDLEEDAITTEVVEVRGRRISEKQQQSALTMESMDNIAIRETPAANFYDGLGSLKDVDLTAASLGFKIINTRGFNSTSPVRSLQIIDGVDNQSPGLNFSLGNFLGASELDVNRVNLIVGASSAFYGPNAFNGVISMETKNPFLHKGLSAMVKVGERNLVETGFRWAQASKNKEGYENFAYKINFSYFRADDWEAENYDDVFDTPSDESNPGGYDAVNIYGDEYQLLPLTYPKSRLSNLGHRSRPPTRIPGNRPSRLQFQQPTKIGAAFHFRLKPELDIQSPEFIIASNYSRGTTVYQGDNRFSLRNIQFFQHRLELQKRDKYFLRAYVTHEDAGDSYDPYFTALLLAAKCKSDDPDWLADYLNFWQSDAVPELRSIEGFPRLIDYLGRPDDYRAAVDDFLIRPDVQ
jgi:iron complex outermembrane receptor protein